MKKILLTVGLLCGFCASDAEAGNFHGLLSRDDTLSIPFAFLDSAGNVIDLNTTADSLYLTVWSPGGDSVYAEKLRCDDARVDVQVPAGPAFQRANSFNIVVGVADGTSTSFGTYSYSLMTFDATAANISLHTYFTGTFQVIHATVEFNDRFDFLDEVISTRTKIGDTSIGGDTRDVAIAAIRDSLQFLITSSGDTAIGGDERDVAIAAMRDSLQFLITSSGDTALGGDEILAATVVMRDSLSAIIDSLQSQDDWGAKEASLLTAADNIGINWGDITNQSTAVDLSATTTNLVNTATTVTNDVGITDADMGFIADSVGGLLLTGGVFTTNGMLGKILRDLKTQGLIHTGTSDNVPTNTASTISLETGGGDPVVISTDDYYNHQNIIITGGTGVGQVRTIPDYMGSNQSATIAPDWIVTPDATSEYTISPGITHSQTVAGGYDGCVHIGPNGSTGTELYVDGINENVIDDGSFANAKIVADALGLTRFCLHAGASITLADTYDLYQFEGSGYSVALGGQSISGARFIGGSISGVGTGAARIVFRNCVITDVELPPFAMIGCALTGQVKMSAAGSYRILATSAGLADGDAQISFGTSLTQGLVLHDWHGNMVIDSMGEGVTDSISVTGQGELTFNASNVSGAAWVRGAFDITDNSSTLTSLDQSAAFDRFSVAQHASDSTLAKDTSDINIASSFGLMLKDTIAYQGTAGAGTTPSAVWDAVSVRGITEADGSNSTTQLKTNLAEATDDHYIGNYLLMINGDEELESRYITDYIGATGILVFTPALTAIPTDGDSIRIMPNSWVVADSLSAQAQSLFASKQEVASEVTDSNYLSSISDRNQTASTWGISLSNLIRSMNPIFGTIDGATPTVSGFSATELSQGDDYWNNQMIMILSGSAAGQAARISDFTAATDSITLSPVLSVAPAQNDTFIILGLLAEASSGGDATAASQTLIIDTVNATLDTLQLWDTRIDSLEAALADANIGDKVWTDADTGSHNTATTMGQAQALGQFATARTVADSVLNDSLVYQNVTAIDDVTAAASNLEKAYDLDGVLLDSVEFTLRGGIFSDNYYDSIANRSDSGAAGGGGDATAASQTLIIDTVNAILDTLQNQDDWVAHQTTVDSIYDSLALHEASGGGGSDTTAIKTMLRGNAALFTYTDQMNLVRNAGFEEDSVVTPTAPAGWTAGIGDEAGNHTETADAGGGRFRYATHSSGAFDTSMVYQRIGNLPAGHYYLGGTALLNQTGDAIIVIDNAIPTTTSAHIDSVVIISTAGTALHSGKIIQLTATTDSYIGLRFNKTVGGDTAYFDNIMLLALTLDTSDYQGSGGSGLDTLSTAFQLRLASLIADTNWLALLSARDGVAGSFGDSAKLWAGAGGGLDTLSTAFQLRLASLIADTNWLALLEARDGVAGSFGDSSQGWGATGSGSGSGASTINIAVTDTSGTDTTVSGVFVTLRDIAGNQIGEAQKTNSSGYTTWGLTTGDSMTVQIASILQNNHIWNVAKDTIIIGADGDSVGVPHLDTILTGYDFTVSSPASDTLCNVYGFIENLDGTPAWGAAVRFMLPGDNVSAAGVFIGQDGVTVYTDSLGFFEKDLIRSSEANDRKYNWTWKFGDFESGEYNITVPDSVSFKITTKNP